MKTPHKQYISLRTNRGAAVIALCLALSLLLVFIGFFVYDMNRAQMAQRQLNAISDAAALAGTAMLTSKDVSYENANLDVLYTTQLAAEQYAKNMFVMGNILGQQLYDPAASGTPPGGGIPIMAVTTQSALINPSAGAVNVLVQLCAPINNYAVVPPGTSSARSVYVQANYGYVPYLSMLGVGSVPLTSSSTSSLQKLAVTMVFDCSGSMDDNTVVTFVERRWTTPADGALDQLNNGTGAMFYQVVGNPGTGSSAGQLWQYAGLNYANQPNGTALNVLPPQNLDYLGLLYANKYTSYAGSSNAFPVNPPLAFDYAIRSYVCWPAGIGGTPNSSNPCYPNNGLSGFQGPYYDNDFGTPPGNCRVKYGPAPSGTTYGAWWQGMSPTVTESLNIWNDKNPAHAPGPGASPGYTYYPNGASNPNDGNIYFYDPYSIPGLYTGNAYTPFTDMVVNLTPVNSTSPQTQPLYGPSPFVGFNYTFSTSLYTVTFAENTASNGISTYSTPYEADAGTTGQLSGNSYNFSSIAYLVEASRGNLDLDNNGYANNYQESLLYFGNANGIAHPQRGEYKFGYQKAYQRLAMYCSQPYATAVDGAFRFFQNLTATSSCIFGFVGFSVAPATTASYKCSYLTPNNYSQGYYSLALGAPANTTKPTAVLSSWVYQPKKGTNPNFWVTSPFASSNLAPSGPAGGDGTQGVGLPYNNPWDPSEPNKITWVFNTNGFNPLSNSNTMFAANNPGFQIPRFALQNGAGGGGGGGGAGLSDQQSSYWGVAGPAWSEYWYSITGSAPASDPGQNGLFHCRPLYDTEGLEALQVGLYNLTNIPVLDAKTGLSTNLTLPTLGPGTKRAIVFFTDGVPTDDPSATFSAYKDNVVTPAQNQGVAIYSIGLALNDSLKSTQSQFLKTLANNGANGSQYFQVTSNATLNTTFTGIARQLAQCQR